jgi:hydroxymethylbilane synthase
VNPLVLGTRGSALALAQAALARAAIEAAVPGAQVAARVVETSGDRGVVPDARGGLKGLFVKEIDEALLSGAIDLAVHSLKDVPGRLPDGIAIGGVLERAPSEDLLIVKRPRPAEACVRYRVGTSSVRRARELEWRMPGAEIVPVRGNVPTRLAKLGADEGLDAIVLAAAGLARLGIDLAGYGFVAQPLPLCPAAGQGIVALAVRAGDAAASAVAEAASHGPTWLCARAERELLRRMDGDCRMPVGIHAVLQGGVLGMRALWFPEGCEAPRVVSGEIAAADGEAPERLAEQLFQRLKP